MASILVADDDDAIRDLIGQFLEAAGYATAQASNGREAMRVLETENFDLLITDLIMPDKEGLETISDVRRLYPRMKIVAISGGGRVNSENYLLLAKKLGASATLSKPFLREDLLKTVRLVLGNLAAAE